MIKELPSWVWRVLQLVFVGRPPLTPLPSSSSLLFISPLRSQGLVCCGGWAQLGNECLTRTYPGADTHPSRISLCNAVDCCHLLPFTHQLSARGTSPARKTKCVSVPTNVAAATDTSELAATPVRDSFATKPICNCTIVQQCLL